MVILARSWGSLGHRAGLIIDLMSLTDVVKVKVASGQSVSARFSR